MTRAKRKRRHVYSEGELNRIIDSVVHPLIDQDPAFYLLDVMLHGLVEQDPSETALKFLRWSLPHIVSNFASGLEREKK